MHTKITLAFASLSISLSRSALTQSVCHWHRVMAHSFSACIDFSPNSNRLLRIDFFGIRLHFCFPNSFCFANTWDDRVTNSKNRNKIYLPKSAFKRKCFTFTYYVIEMKFGVCVNWTWKFPQNNTNHRFRRGETRTIFWHLFWSQLYFVSNSCQASSELWWFV